MLALLYDKALKQLQRAEQPEAFMSAWRYLHQLIRSYYIERVGRDSGLEEQKRKAPQINEANESLLFGQFGASCTGVRLDQELERHLPQLWRKYRSAARQARHYMAHGKIFMPGALRESSLDDLTNALLAISHQLEPVFADDPLLSALRDGCPLSPLVSYGYDPSTRKVTIDIDPDLNPPKFWAK